MSKITCETCSVLVVGNAGFSGCTGVKPPTSLHECPNHVLGTPSHRAKKSDKSESVE